MGTFSPPQRTPTAQRPVVTREGRSMGRRTESGTRRQRPVRPVVGLFLLSAALVAGCGGYTPEPANRDGPGGRGQQLGLSPEDELELGRQAYRQALGEYRGRVLSPDSPEAVR